MVYFTEICFLQKKKSNTNRDHFGFVYISRPWTLAKRNPSKHILKYIFFEKTNKTDILWMLFKISNRVFLFASAFLFLPKLQNIWSGDPILSRICGWLQIPGKWDWAPNYFCSRRFMIVSLLEEGPDLMFHNDKTGNFADRLNLCSSEASIYGFCDWKIVKSSVGNGVCSLFSPSFFTTRATPVSTGRTSRKKVGKDIACRAKADQRSKSQSWWKWDFFATHFFAGSAVKMNESTDLT